MHKLLAVAWLAVVACKADKPPGAAPGSSAAPRAEPGRGSPARSGKIELPARAARPAGPSAGSAAPALTPPADRGPRGRERMMTFDTDGDGIISDEEREVARQRREELVRARVDTDGDGQVSEAERAAARRDRAGRVHASLDRDGDGRVTPDELGATDARGLDVQVADTDGDGALSVAELETVWAERRARRFELRRQRAAGSGAPGAPSAHDAPTSPP